MRFKTRGNTSISTQAGHETQLHDACKVLEHYHIAHTDDIVTRFKASGIGADIYVVQDPGWKARLERCVEEIFPKDGPDFKDRGTYGVKEGD